MTDFAAAAMLRLVRAGLQRQGLVAEAPRPVAGALVPLQDKRALLDALLQRHGPALLLRLGEAVHDVADEPTLTALTAARDAADLVARWQRLERFVHARHRVVVLAAQPSGCTLRHVSLRPGDAPRPAEDLLVFGLLVGLLQRIGTAELRARFAGEGEGEGEGTWRQQDGRWQPWAPPADTSTWTLAWRQPAQSPSTAPPPAGAATPDAARALLAAALGLAPRTLQRRLAEAGTGFSALWTEVRLAQSARLLVADRAPAVQVGFLCGFADQAHFTRSFKRHTAMTPVVYRAQFGLAATPAA